MQDGVFIYKNVLKIEKRPVSCLLSGSARGVSSPPNGGQEPYDSIQTQSSDAVSQEILYVSQASKSALCFVISN